MLHDSMHLGEKPKARALIVGAGFSGTMVAVQLARLGIPSILIDPAERPARGIAYWTTSSCHRLNVRASNMSAFPDTPDDFASHVEARGGRPDSFASRKEYGDYLEAKLAPCVAAGLVTLVRERALEARPCGDGWQVGLADGAKLRADVLVLANGNAPPAPLKLVSDVVRAEDLLENLWTPASSARLDRAAAMDEPVLIVGTGLTMVDAVLALNAAGHRGAVTAVSRRGLLPLAHAQGGPSALPPPTLGEIPQAPAAAMRWLRSRAGAEEDWRTAIDSLRPLMQQLWQRMDLAQQRRFLRHARAWWDVHRHRLAPDIHSKLSELRREQRLRVLSGRLVGAARHASGYSVGVAARGSGDPIEVEAGLVINCTGPLSSIRDNPDRLVRQMVADGLMRPDALDLGVEVRTDGTLSGCDRAYGIGPITRGHYWEITAVPDLRVKAAEIASAISRAMTAAQFEMV
jgi:uncharacterized NAD(P)/FAD-binding protein YdhS